VTVHFDDAIGKQAESDDSS
jgi:hypothetical protein